MRWCWYGLVRVFQVRTEDVQILKAVGLVGDLNVFLTVRIYI